MPGNSRRLATFFSAVRLREVILVLQNSKWVSGSTSDRCLPTKGLKCRMLEAKLLGPQFSAHFWEVTTYGTCPLAGSFDCMILNVDYRGLLKK